MTQSDKFQTAIAGFDAANGQDPATETVEGTDVPKALLYARRMSQRLQAIGPDASEPLQLAVRAQHLMRWAFPRDGFPEGRKGYHQWRTAAARFHGEKAGGIMRGAGYDESVIVRVQTLLRKERLKLDPEVQTLEDVACLVFLEHYLSDFAQKHESGKVMDILRKTWRKMSSKGQQAALALPLTPDAKDFVERALSG